jgi:hypothetical protein
MGLVVAPAMKSAMASCGWLAVLPVLMYFMCSTRSR